MSLLLLFRLRNSVCYRIYFINWPCVSAVMDRLRETIAFVGLENWLLDPIDRIRCFAEYTKDEVESKYLLTLWTECFLRWFEFRASVSRLIIDPMTSRLFEFNPTFWPITNTSSSKFYNLIGRSEKGYFPTSKSFNYSYKQSSGIFPFINCWFGYLFLCHDAIS